MQPKMLNNPTFGAKLAQGQILLKKSDSLALQVAQEYFTPLS